MPASAALLLGARHMYSTACARLMRHSGYPMTSVALKAASATSSACGSALPMSSEARIKMRRAMNFGSSPASIMRASQYRAASGSDPRMDFMNAEIMS